MRLAIVVPRRDTRPLEMGPTPLEMGPSRSSRVVPTKLDNNCPSIGPFGSGYDTITSPSPLPSLSLSSSPSSSLSSSLVAQDSPDYPCPTPHRAQTDWVQTMEHGRGNSRSSIYRDRTRRIKPCAWRRERQCVVRGGGPHRRGASPRMAVLLHRPRSKKATVSSVVWRSAAKVAVRPVRTMRTASRTRVGGGGWGRGERVTHYRAERTHAITRSDTRHNKLGLGLG